MIFYPADMACDAAESECWLCLRALGARVEWHHPLPRAKGGRQTVPLHPICHRAIHAHFTNGQLARIGFERNVLTSHGALAAFLRWIANKPPDFHAPTRARRQ